MRPDGLGPTVVAAVFGAVIGSFLNVCIHRLPRGESIVHPPSRCPQCGRRLRWYENIPVFSWLALRGRCAGCGTRIPVMYPLVELATAALFMVAWRMVGPSPLLPIRLLFACAMIVLAVTDLRDRLLPNAITYPGIVVGIAASLVFPPGVASALIGAGGGALLLWAVGEGVGRLLGKDALGFGDVKMIAMIGAFLGWQLALVSLFLASVIGSVVGLAVVAVKGRDYLIPLGTFLAVGGLTSAFVGPDVLSWYLGFYR